jgi:hypothetical protein
MQIDRDTLIAGLRPVEVKKIVRHTPFCLEGAMARLKQTRPAARKMLDALVAEGYLETHKVPRDQDNPHGVMNWHPTLLGQRLTATKLIARTPLAKARAVLPAIVEEARAVNREATYPYRIERLILFGSTLTGCAGDTVGDIDIVVELERRPLPEPERKKVFDDMVEAGPGGFFTAISWPNNAPLKRIKKVSRLISLHEMDDIVAKAPQRVIYQFDMSADHEVSIPPLRL